MTFLANDSCFVFAESATGRRFKVETGDGFGRVSRFLQLPILYQIIISGIFQEVWISRRLDGLGIFRNGMNIQMNIQYIKK